MIREVDPLDYLGRIGNLLTQHWAETGADYELVPNVQLYAQAHRSGQMLCLVATEGEELLGYATGMLSPILYNPDVMICACDALFVTPERRNTILPGRLIQAMEQRAKERGATHVWWMTHARTDLHETFARHGYAPADISMMKRLT